MLKQDNIVLLDLKNDFGTILQFLIHALFINMALFSQVSNSKYSLRSPTPHMYSLSTKNTDKPRKNGFE